MKHNYSTKPEPSTVLVRVVDMADLTGREPLFSLISRAGRLFGFSVETTNLAASAPSERFVMRHVLVRAPGGFDQELVIRVAAAAAKWQSSASIAFEYVDESDMFTAEPHINKLKYELGDSINFLRPDSFSKLGARVSDQKLSDNAVCDSVRIKFTPNCLDEHPFLPKLSNDELEFFSACVDVYKRRKLYLRGPSDGYFAYRRENGFLITATKTRKDESVANRVVFVADYSEVSGIVSYCGAYLPSSDSVEAAVFFEQRPDVVGILHSHASRLLTRNSAYASKIAVARMPYGEPALGYALARELDRYPDGLLIMEEHGEIFCARREPQFMFFERVNRICDEAARTLGEPA
jgi:hypothetical protein